MKLKHLIALFFLCSLPLFSADFSSQFKGYPSYVIGNEKYVSLKTLIKVLHIQNWGRIEDRVFFEYQEKSFKTRIGSNEITVDNKKQLLPSPIKEIEGEIHFPLLPLEGILGPVKSFAAAPTPEKNLPPQVEERKEPFALGTMQEKDKPFVILIDAGHGGHDDGARGNYGLKEKDVNLDISLRMKKYLSTQLKHIPNIRFETTRETDIFLSLNERVDIAKRMKADIFFCVHTNSSKFNRLNADGFETYYPRQKENLSFSLPKFESDDMEQVENHETLFQIVDDLNATSVIEESRVMAEMVQEHLAERLICPDRGAKSANFYVLKYTPMISVLMEVGFICNPNIEANLRDPEVRQAISETLGKAVITYLQTRKIII